VSKLERRDREERESEDFNPYLYLTLGLGFVIATILVIATTGAAITGLPFVLAAATLLGIGVSELRGQQRALAQPVSQERELLAAIRENGGSITPAEAAMETSLTVRGADEMLSALTGGGHLQLESQSGTLYYSLPARREKELGG
jgi:hypothetical protein